MNPVAGGDELRGILLAWFDAQARDLPWRGLDDPYAVLVCEVMSQQTRIETVRDYWTRWMHVFPTFDALAAADEDAVMRQWAGLGYYRRARNLHACAREIVNRHGGAVPATAAALRELPGVGPYTAAAVASIVFGEVVAAVDGNVSRVAARLAALTDEPGTAGYRRGVDAVAVALIDPDRPGASNEALMELGATICAPRSPRCAACPAAPWCAARASGAPERFGAAAPRKAPRPQSCVAIVATAQDQVFLRKGDAKLLGGLWQFPTVADADLVDALRTVHADHGIEGPATPAGTVEHLFSHIRMTYVVARVEVADPRVCRGGRWVSADDLHAEALSVAMRKVAACAQVRPAE